MKPETGNNSVSADVRKVSVRIESGGHSFSVDALPKLAFDENAAVEFVVITHKTVLVPDELFDEAAAGDFLAVAGLPCAAGEMPLCIPDEGCTAVAAVSAECLSEIARQFGPRARFVSPMVMRSQSAGRRLYIRTFGKVSYFNLWDEGRLRLAEAFVTADADEILYYVCGLDRNFGLGEYHIYIYGDGADETAKLLKRYFKNVKCE